MPARRSCGDGGLYWDRSRKRWIAEVTIGYSPGGKRIGAIVKTCGSRSFRLLRAGDFHPAARRAFR